MKKHKKTDSARPAIALLCLILIICVLLLGYFVFWPRVITGSVFDDRNGDGKRQRQTEDVLPGREVRLVNAADNVVATKRTRRNGEYRFNRLAAGTYRVEVDSPSGDAVAKREVTITRRGEVNGIDVGVPPEKPKDQIDLRRNHNLWAKENGGNEETERAVDLALKWLAEHQCGDGGWFFDLKECRNCRGKCGNSEAPRFDRTAATALALLPFLGRGITHKNSHPADAHYRMTVARGVAFLQDRVADNGKVDRVREDWTMYSQGLAGIVLAEMAAMVVADQRNAEANKPKQPDNPNDERIDDKTLLEDAKRVLEFIARAQDPEGGGWRYKPLEQGDTSVVGWQMMALHAGRKEVLDKPDTWKRAAQFLDFVQADGGATYGYTDNSAPEPRRSAIGLLCRMYDWPEKDASLRDGVSRIAKFEPTKDLYFDYYATQVIYHMAGPKGQEWKEWNEKMTKLLLDAQRQPKHGHEAGSWFEGVDESKDNIHLHGGRLYCTSLAAMILEVYHRQLRIYRPRDPRD